MSIYHFDLNHTEALIPLFNMCMQLLNDRTNGGVMQLNHRNPYIPSSCSSVLRSADHSAAVITPRDWVLQGVCAVHIG